MPKGYLVAHIRVHDEAGIAQFRKLAGPAIAEFGGRVLVTNPTPDHREGDLRGVAVVIEFDDLETVRRFYDSPGYTAARQVRQAAADTDLMIVQGV